MHKAQENNIVFVGGSLVSLMMALYYKKHLKCQERVVVIEKAQELGGHYRSFKYDDDLIFDHGLHLYAETNIAEADELFLDILGHDNWKIMEGRSRNICGTVFNGKLQRNTPFPDLRNLTADQIFRYSLDIKSRKPGYVDPNKYCNAEEFLIDKFGPRLYKDVFRNILKKHYRKDPFELDPMATHILPLGRIALHDTEQTEKFMSDATLGSRIAFPDQDTMPLEFFRQERMLYPKKMGMYQIIEKLIEKLEACGVEIYKNSTVEKLELEEGRCTSLSFSLGKKLYSIENISELYWNGGYPLLAKYLGFEKPSMQPEFTKSAFVNIVLDKPLDAGKLYYFYNCSPESSIFRVANFYNYCPDSISDKGYPICVNTFLHDTEGTVDKELVQEQVIDELKQMQVLTDHKINFIRTEIPGRGVPNLTTEFIKEMDRLRNSFEAQNYKNINVVGMLAQKNQFYLSEVIAHAFTMLKSLQTI